MSGLQCMGIMSGCTTTASNSNIIPKLEKVMTAEAVAKLEQLEEELASLN